MNMKICMHSYGNTNYLEKKKLIVNFCVKRLYVILLIFDLLVDTFIICLKINKKFCIDDLLIEM